MTDARAGFTLIEVVVALAVMAIIGAMSWQALSSSMQARDFLEAEEEFQRSAHTALSRIQRHVELAYLTDATSAVNTYQTVFIGKDGGERDELWFASLGHRRRYMNSRESDQTELTLWTESDPEVDGAFVLLMREAQRIDERPDEDGGVLPLAHGVERFDLYYLDPGTGEWVADWDTTGADQPNRLPRAVQLVLELRAPVVDEDEDEDRTRTFVRTIQVAFADTLNRDAQFLNSQDPVEE